MTNYDDMTEQELEAAYEMRFHQRWPDRSLLLRRVLKMHGLASSLFTEQQGRPASDPPNRTGVYLIHDGLGFGICEYFTGVDDGDGTCAGWIPENDDEIYVVRWWHLPDVPQRETQP